MKRQVVVSPVCVSSDDGGNPVYMYADDFICAYYQKGGTKSISTKCRELNDGQIVKVAPEEALKLRDTVPIRMYIRDPFDRLESAYCFFTQRQAAGRDHGERRQFKNFDEFAHTIFSIWDPHWSPVVPLHTVDGVFIPTDVRPFEMIGEFVGSERHNASVREPLPWTPELRARVREHWAEDFELRDRVIQEYDVTVSGSSGVAA